MARLRAPDASQQVLDKLDGRQLAAADAPGRLGDGEIVQLVHHARLRLDVGGLERLLADAPDRPCRDLDRRLNLWKGVVAPGRLGRLPEGGHHVLDALGWIEAKRHSSALRLSVPVCPASYTGRGEGRRATAPWRSPFGDGQRW